MITAILSINIGIWASGIIWGNAPARFLGLIMFLINLFGLYVVNK